MKCVSENLKLHRHSIDFGYRGKCDNCLDTFVPGGTLYPSIRGDPCQYLGSEILQKNRIWNLQITAQKKFNI